MICAARALLVAQQRLPRALGIDAHRLRRELALDRLGVAARQAQRGEQAERDRLAVRQVEVGRRLERVAERVAEVEPAPRAVVVRVAQAERRLVGGRAAHVELAAREQPRLHELGHALPPLALGQRVEQLLVDHDARRPVERADEVLALGDVDRGLAADRRVDLADERRRHRDPRHAAQVRRRREARRRRSCSRRRARRACRRGRAAARSRAAAGSPVAFASSPDGSSCVVVSRSPSACCARGP